MSVLRVDSAALRSHAGRLDSIAGRGQQAIDAAETTSLASDSLGGLCGPLIGAVLGPVEAAGCLNARLAVGLVTASAAGLRDVADHFDGTDDGLGRGIAAIGGRL